MPGHHEHVLRFSKVWTRLDDVADYYCDVMTYYQECEFEDLLPDENDITKSATAIHRWDTEHNLHEVQE